MTFRPETIFRPVSLWYASHNLEVLMRPLNPRSDQQPDTKDPPALFLVLLAVIAILTFFATRQMFVQAKQDLVTTAYRQIR